MARLKIVETLPPVHRGEVLLEEFLHPPGMSVQAAAKALHAPNTGIDQIVGPAPCGCLWHQRP